MAAHKTQDAFRPKPVIPHTKVPRRKRLLINPQFQALFALYAVVTTLLMVPIFFAVNYYFFNLFSAYALSLGLPPNHEILQFAARQQTLLVVVFLDI